MSELGSKQKCPGCGVKFYDLGKKPAECPGCGKKFEVSAVPTARRPQKIKPLKPTKPPGKTVPTDTGGEDIDLSGFEVPDDDAGGEDTMGSLSEIEEMDEEVETLSEVGGQEREEDLLNSDDGEDEAFIEEMDGVETLVDHPDDGMEDEETEEEKEFSNH